MKDIYYCFRYKCKRCPKNKQCERGDTIERARKPNTTKRENKGRTKKDC